MSENLAVELFDEDGNVIEVEHLLTYEHEGNHYIAFGELNANDEYGVIIFAIEEKDGEDVYVPIDNEILAEEVWATFKDLYSEEDDEDDE